MIAGSLPELKPLSAPGLARLATMMRLDACYYARVADRPHWQAGRMMR